MRLIRVGTAAVSVKVGDFRMNTGRLRDAIAAARDGGVHLLATPELGISGYSLEDRVFWKDIALQSWDVLQEVALDCKSISAFVGLPVCIDALMYNAAAFIHDGHVRGLILKKYLPTYSVFYEGRHWTPWTNGVTEVNGVPAGDLVFKLPFGMVSAEICEDLWSQHSPAHARVMAGAEIICNSSASPFTPRKNEYRRRLVLGAAGGLLSIYAYANVLGCDSSRLVFDGGGFVASPDGVEAEGPILSQKPWTLASGVVDLDEIARLRAESSTWRQQVLSYREKAERPKIIDLSDGEYEQAPVRDFVKQMPKNFFMPEHVQKKDEETAYLDELFDGLVLGLRDYFEKVGVFERFLVALSGGRDSALCLLMAVHAAKALKGGTALEEFAQRIETVYLPNSKFSSNATETAARELAEAMGVPFKVVSIQEEAEAALHRAIEMVGSEERVTPLARQNLQARVRSGIMLNWANNEQGLLLVTSNLSEAAVGYTTTGGDNQGGYSPIANVPKTLVTRLLQHLAARDNLPALQKVLDIPPSAELAEDQRDEDDLMPYAVLDDLLYLFAKRRMSLPDCWRVLCHRYPEKDNEQLRAWTADFGKRFVYSQWKRDQHPVPMKVMDLDLDPKTGFRFPVTQSIRHELDALAEATLY